MKTYRLVSHPAHPPAGVTEVVVDVWADTEEVLLTFRVEGQEALQMPDLTMASRRDELWKTTCFEIFLQPVGAETYFEFNLSPSTEWAVYRFERYRDGMSDLEMPVEPYVDRGDPSEDYIVEADIDLSAIPQGQVRIGLSAVIEERDGTKSYWALCHPPGDKPDFHHPDCFAAELSPAGEP